MKDIEAMTERLATESKNDLEKLLLDDKDAENTKRETKTALRTLNDYQGEKTLTSFFCGQKGQTNAER